MSVVLPAERHLGVSKIDEPVVGDCDAVRVFTTVNVAESYLRMPLGVRMRWSVVAYFLMTSSIL